MPTYEYQCTKCEHSFEIVQKMTEDALTICDKCGGRVRRVLFPVGIVFKGSGFHINDYGKSGSKTGGNDSSSIPAASKEPEKPAAKEPEKDTAKSS